MKISDHINQAVLHRIANALGVPVERFFTDEMSTETAANADECLRLWSKIATETGRRQALRVLREIAELERI